MKTKAFIIVLVLQCALLLGLVTQQELRLASPTTVLLETAPVDPRDLLRGDYVILSYKISSLAATNLSPAISDLRAADGMPVVVALEKRGQFHEVASASLGQLEAGTGQVLLKGRAVHSWSGQMRVEYGLERYYVKEGTGNPRGKLTVEVAVSSGGKGVIKQVFLDGKPYAEAMRHQRQ